MLRIFAIVMGIVLLMIIVSVGLAFFFLILFLIGVKSGQFDEGESPAVRMLFDNNKPQSEHETNKN